MSAYAVLRMMCENKSTARQGIEDRCQIDCKPSVLNATLTSHPLGHHNVVHAGHGTIHLQAPTPLEHYDNCLMLVHQGIA